MGLTPSATHEQVRQAYIDHALRYHPDRQTGQDVAGRAEAERRMQAANSAWAVLGDPEARATYDAELGVVPGDAAAESGSNAVATSPVRVRTLLRRIAPLLIVLAVLAAILLFTAHAGPAPS